MVMLSSLEITTMDQQLHTHVTKAIRSLELQLESVYMEYGMEMYLLADVSEVKQS